jgi:hypothetical protein
MHSFDYKIVPQSLLVPDVVNMLSVLHEYKGKQELYIEAKKDVLSSLLQKYKAQKPPIKSKEFSLPIKDYRL